MVIVTTVVLGTGGTAAPVVAPIVQTSVASIVYGPAGAAVVEGATAVAQTAIAAAEIQATIASGVAANAAIAGAPALVAGATGAGGATTAAATAAVANSWNPVGWLIGTILVGASQCTSTSQTVTWGCYKPIIDEADNESTSAGPITLAALASHSKVQRISVGLCASSAGLPEVKLTNTAGELYLLRGIPLPWGGAAYHAERIDNE